jgi:hypothetical protein
MDYRTLTVSAILAAAVVGFTPISRADIVASDDGIAVRDAGVAAPARGMTMTQVESKFGDPVTKVPAVGKPPISRWEYSGFVVYFEHDHVIHSVVSGSGPADSPAVAAAPAEAAPAAATAADSSPAAPAGADATASASRSTASASAASPPTAAVAAEPASADSAPAATARADSAPPPTP